MADLAAALADRTPILTDGGIETRVMFESEYAMDPHVQVAAMVGDPPGRAILWRIYASYVDVAKHYGLPVVIGTPTFRASPNFIRRAGLDGATALYQLNAEATQIHREIRTAADYDRVYIAGVIGPSGDAYTPAEALGPDAAADYHRRQANALAECGCDLLFAPTFPAVGEAIGACRAMAETGMPYVISYVLDGDGRVLDGTPLGEAIQRVDAGVGRAPLIHSLSCVHPSVAARAIESLRAEAPAALERLGELKANGSRLATTDLVQLDHPEADPPDEFADALWRVYDPGGLQVLGGCCGTTDSHMAALAERMAGAAAT